ncbi:MAG: hypothetical protein KDK36_03450, partial [Leptospiraceae bacterium]|nr:hypothetical protein [Leptospiraceae bacterium]
MSIKNKFKIGLKKHELEENEKKSHERKHSFLKNIEDCESRLETIEICNSNSKLNDSILLSRYLLIDITNTLLQFYNQSEINDFGLVKSSLEKIPNADIVSRLEENILSLNFFFEDEENCSKIELALTDAIYFIRKNIISKHSQELYSPLDDYKSRIRFQTVIILILLILISGKLTTDYIKKRPLGPDNFEISYSIIKDTNPDDSNKKSFEINTKG